MKKRCIISICSIIFFIMIGLLTYIVWFYTISLPIRGERHFP